MRRLFLSLVLLCTAAAAPAQVARDTGPLIAALGVPEMIAIMREEGIGYGADLEDDLFPARGGARWAALVERIYDSARMEQTVSERLARELDGADTGPMLDFFASDRGKRIVGLELSARRALLDEEVDAASREALQRLIREDAPRLQLIQEFAEANELVDSNVVGAMNSNYAFYSGLAQGGAFPEAMSEDEILRDVWSQEDAIRADTEEWLFSYLALAYQPLDDDDLRAYVAFSRTPEGQILNRALFAAFDEMFVAVSLALGQAASNFIAGEEL